MATSAAPPLCLRLAVGSSINSSFHNPRMRRQYSLNAASTQSGMRVPTAIRRNRMGLR